MNKAKFGIDELMDEYGCNLLSEFLDSHCYDNIVPGICRECGFVTDVEPDAEKSRCEDCGANTVVSALVLLRLI